MKFIFSMIMAITAKKNKNSQGVEFIRNYSELPVYWIWVFNPYYSKYSLENSQWKCKDNYDTGMTCEIDSVGQGQILFKLEKINQTLEKSNI